MFSINPIIEKINPTIPIPITSSPIPDEQREIMIAKSSIAIPKPIFFIETSPSQNSNLSTQPSENSVFSRLFACVILKPYVFSLVFALMSENKGNFLLFAADYLIQQPCGSTLRFPCSVSVDIHCGTDISVSEKLLHILWGSPI